MSYYDNRDYLKPHSGDRGYAADYYDEPPINQDYVAQRDYGSRQSRRPRHEFRRRASSVGEDPSYHFDNRSQRDPSRAYEGSYSQRSKRDSSSESGRSSRHKNRSKSTGGAPRNDHHDRYRSRDGGRDNGNHDRGWADRLRDKGGELIVQAALPLIAAGAAEALRSRKEPGEWKGEKGKHVMKAAVTNGLINKDPNKPHTHHIVDTTVSGLKEGHPTREEISQIQRRADGSHTLSNLKKIAAASALVFAGKEIYDRYDRSRSQNRSQGYEDDSYGSKKRSQSVSDDFNHGMGSLDLEESDYRRPQSKYGDDRLDHWESYSGRDRNNRVWDYPSDEYPDSDLEVNYHDDDDGRERGSRDLDRARSLNDSKTSSSAKHSTGYIENTPGGDCSCSECDSDLGDSSDEKEKAKKMKRDMLLTSGLATVATIHAAHKVYGSVNKRKQRMNQLQDGEITLDEARKERIKANTIDAASIGLAALGIKGAYGEWKEVNEKRKETQNFKDECIRRARQRELRRNRRHS
ncbi:hypothetical protein N7490_009809 [Penicillium lividum]|nr:hypothetical protein N7490_009809 [Penicillium lividum]